MKFAKALLAILALGSAAHLSAAEYRPDVNIGIGTNSGNYCAGGLEDSKLIERGERIDNATKQTTVLEGRATGGTPLIMPDLPEPKADREALA